MIASFYNNSSDNRVVHKSLSVIASNVSIDANGQIDVTNPVIKLNMNENILLSNYMYIPKWNRYYYITEMRVLNGNQIEITGHCDVLMSFWNNFKNSLCVAQRSSSNYDEYIDDDLVIIKDKYRIETRKLNGTFTPSAAGSNHYVLTIGGMM